MVSNHIQLVFPARSLADAERLSDMIEMEARIAPLAVTITETDEARGLWETAAYFISEQDAEAARESFGTSAELRSIADVDWVRRSLEGLSPVTAGRFFLHGSHDRSQRRAGGIALEIDAGTAFGTGHHATTTGCLLALDTLLKRRHPLNVLDLGCGTGVLAIAAARATSARIMATDIDPEAIRVTAINARINGVAPRVRALTAAGLHAEAIHGQAPFDLIFANILARPLAELAQGLAALLAPSGALILSGLTRDQSRWIKSCYRNRGLIMFRTIEIGNWATLVLRKP
jgi:ribosomal protein L11 methyltransferase